MGSLGPLIPLLDGFARSLQERGYRQSTIDQYISKCRTFDAFLSRREIDVASLDEHTIEEFLAAKLLQRKHRDEGKARRWWTGTLGLLIDHLQRHGAVSGLPSAACTEPSLLLEYANYLRNHRGLCEQTVEGQTRHLGRFLIHIGAKRDTDLLKHILAEHIDGFLVDLSGRMGRQSINSVCAALRGFLRYLHMRGLLYADLSDQVFRPRLYSLSDVPRAMDWRDVEHTLALVDRTTLVGSRDYAVLVLLAYCGLRASEVVRLRLDDIDWSRDKIHLHRRKGDTVDALPLAPLVGEALIGYLRRRPSDLHPQVFLKVLAPVGPLSSPSVAWIARKYLLLAGAKLPRLGSHTFRHSFAVRLLRQGFPLKTIGDVLGHQNPQSTFIYTKAAVEDLRSASLDIEEVLP
jgi:integrase/recombinase XerD